MIAMTIRAGGDWWRSRQGYRLAMTLGTGYFSMAEMRKSNRTLPWGTIPNGNPNGQFDRNLQSTGLVAITASSVIGRLVMADLTTARGLKG